MFFDGQGDAAQTRLGCGSRLFAGPIAAGDGGVGVGGRIAGWFGHTGLRWSKDSVRVSGEMFCKGGAEIGARWYPSWKGLLLLDL